MNIKLFSLFCVMFLQTSIVYGRDTLFVSPSGNGDEYTRVSPGNIAKIGYRLASINKQCDHLVVYLLGGVYELNEPLLITSNEKNSHIDTLTFAGSSSEVAVLSGGKTVSQWKQVKNGVYKAALPSGVNFRQLYVNDKMEIRARFPNRTNEEDYSPYNRVVGFDEKEQTVSVLSSDMENMALTVGSEMVINHHWYQSRFRIDSFFSNDHNFVIKPEKNACKHLFELTYAKMLASGKPYYFENAYNYLDQEREWFFDSQSSMLYYYPPKNKKIDSLNVVYPVLDCVLRIMGTKEKPIENIHIRNIKLGYSNWLLPSSIGIIGTQGVQRRGYTGEMERGILEVEFANEIQISHCQFVGAGDNGAVFVSGVKNSCVIHSHFDQISANGLVIDTYRKGLQPKSNVCEKIVIEDNLIENVGMHYTNGMGIIASYVAKTVIQYNEICYGRYTGIQLGNHFGDNISVMRDNIIRRNNIHHVMQLHDDGGAIYTLALQPGTCIKENWMHDFGRCEWADNFPVNGVFLDNNSGYIRVQDNVFTDLDTVDRIKEQCAGNATTRDNILVNNNSQDSEVKEIAGFRGRVGVVISNFME